LPVGAAIGAVGSLGSAAIGASAAKKAASQQARAAQQARADMLPYSLPGRGAVATLAQLYGIDPATGDVTGQPMNEASLEAFRRSPDYEFARQEGLRGVEFSNAARGMLRSGNNLRGLAEYASGLGTQNFNNYRSSLMQLAQLGSGAAAGTANASMQQGAALASGTVGAANAWGGALGNMGNFAMMYSMMGPNGGGAKSAYQPTGALAPYSAASPMGYSGALPGGVGAFPY
jgi:hypothetical protein